MTPVLSGSSVGMPGPSGAAPPCGNKALQAGWHMQMGLQTPLNKELRHSQSLGCPGQVAGLVALATALKAVIYTKACLDSSGAAARTSFGLLCHVFKIFQHL